MKYKLYSDEEPLKSTTAQILSNRNIPVEEQYEYLNASYDDISSWRAFPEGNMRYAVANLCETIENNDPIFVVVD